MRFQKTGAAALLGHLDLLRELPRVIRRAGLRIQYSQGFNPKPEISFGPALSLGVSSFDEYMDVQLLGVSSDETDLVERLNAVAGMGLCFLQARPLSPQEPRVNALITGARYWLGIPRSVLDGHGGEERLRERVAALMSQSEHSVVRRVKGIGRNVDVRAGLKSLCVESHDDVSARVGLAGRFVGVVAELAISSQGAIKSSEVVEAIFGEPEVPYRAVRLALLRDGGTPFDEVIVSKRSLATESADQIVTSAP
jgi:radical SAM-linked protein